MFNIYSHFALLYVLVTRHVIRDANRIVTEDLVIQGKAAEVLQPRTQRQRSRTAEGRAVNMGVANGRAAKARGRWYLVGGIKHFNIT